MPVLKNVNTSFIFSGCRNIEDRPDLDLDPDPQILACLAKANTLNNNGENSGFSIGPGADQKHTFDKVSREFINSITIKSEKSTRDTKDMMQMDGVEAYIDGTANSSNLIEKPQCNFITQEVVDATIQCMITQADECEKNGLPSYQTEKMVMEELGRCLVEIIDFSIRNTDSSYSLE